MSCGCNKTNKKKCSCKVPCGCGDGPIHSAAPCNIPPCVNGDTCPETFSAACIVWTGPALPDVGINTGDRVDVILQKLFLLTLNSGCVLPTAPCQSPLGLTVTQATSSTISISWLPVTNATSYQVSFKPSGGTAWSINPAVTNVYDIIGYLSAGTSYDIKVTAICSTGNCTSLTIQTQTLNQ